MLGRWLAVCNTFYSGCWRWFPLPDETSAAISRIIPHSLEDQLQRELNLPRCRRGGSDLAYPRERRLLIRSQNGGGPIEYRCGRRHAQVGMVQNIEDLGAELNGSLFAQPSNCCVLDDRKIPFRQVWPAQNSARRIPQGPASKRRVIGAWHHRLHAENVGIDPLICI